MSATTKARYWVVCDIYRRGPFASVAAAERARDQIEEKGHCLLDHRIEEEAA